MNRTIFIEFAFVCMLAFFFMYPHHAFADSSTSGYAWSENTGWVDFSQVIVNDASLSGYAYSPNIGWISLNCANTSSCGTTDYKVSNTNGTLAGYAWSENTGYIDFGLVIIDTSTGVFSGSAYSPNIGWLSMNCTNTASCGTTDYKVTTGWRPPVVVSSRRGGTTGYYPRVVAVSNSTSSCAPTDRFNTVTGALCPNTPPPQASPILLRTLKLTTPPMRGEDVISLQTYLNTHRYAIPLLVADGVFGMKTKSAVIALQKKHTVQADGIVGTITRRFINTSN